MPVDLVAVAGNLNDPLEAGTAPTLAREPADIASEEAQASAGFVERGEDGLVALNAHQF